MAMVILLDKAHNEDVEKSSEINVPVDITQNLERYKPGYLGLTKEDIDQVNGELDAYFAKQKLGISVQIARENLGLTQQQLTLLSGVPQSEISRIEKGRANPTYLTLCRLAKALEMPAPLSQGLVAKD